MAGTRLVADVRVSVLCQDRSGLTQFGEQGGVPSCDAAHRVADVHRLHDLVDHRDPTWASSSISGQIPFIRSVATTLTRANPHSRSRARRLSGVYIAK